jgi:hypothetical protein
MTTKRPPTALIEHDRWIGELFEAGNQSCEAAKKVSTAEPRQWVAIDAGPDAMSNRKPNIVEADFASIQA